MNTENKKVELSELPPKQTEKVFSDELLNSISNAVEVVQLASRLHKLILENKSLKEKISELENWKSQAMIGCKNFEKAIFLKDEKIKILEIRISERDRIMQNMKLLLERNSEL